MTTVTYFDAGGAPVTLFDVNGRNLVSSVSAERWNNITTLEARGDDVFICAYPKSGNHWIWEITAMLRKGDATPVKDIMENHHLEFCDPEQLSSPRTLATHRYYHELPKKVKDNGCRIVHVLRNPKDICVSYYHQMVEMMSVNYDGKFNDFVSLFLDGKVPFNSWTDYVLSWADTCNRHPEIPIHVLHFEEMKENPTGEIRRLADFLGVTADDSLIRDIAFNTQFDLMKKAKLSMEYRFAKAMKSGTNIMYRKGEVDDWRNWFTEERLQEFDQHMQCIFQGRQLGPLQSITRYICETSKL